MPGLPWARTGPAAELIEGRNIVTGRGAHFRPRFEEFSDDFATWVMFYGPEGGEAADRST